MEKVFALSIEAFRAPLEHYDAALDALWGDEHEAAALRGLREFLVGAGSGRRNYQAPVSYRIVPRILGHAHRALATAERAATVSLASISDNPVYIPPDDAHPLGRCISTGGYHNAMAAPALDDLAAIWADICLLCDRHGSKLLNGKVSLLPDLLMTGRHWADSDGHGNVGYVPMAIDRLSRTGQACGAAHLHPRHGIGRRRPGRRRGHGVSRMDQGRARRPLPRRRLGDAGHDRLAGAACHRARGAAGAADHSSPRSEASCRRSAPTACSDRSSRDLSAWFTQQVFEA